MVQVIDPSAVTLYASDLTRAAQTATTVAQWLGVAAAPVSELREKSYGEGQGMAEAWFRERFVPPPPVGERMHHHEGLVGAETKAERARRVYRGMDQIARDDATDRVIVTHGGTATFVIAHWIGMPIDAVAYVSFPVSPGSITHLREDDYFHNRSVVSLNDTSHLGL